MAKATWDTFPFGIKPKIFSFDFTYLIFNLLQLLKNDKANCCVFSSIYFSTCWKHNNKVLSFLLRFYYNYLQAYMVHTMDDTYLQLNRPTARLKSTCFLFLYFYAYIFYILITLFTSVS